MIAELLEELRGRGIELRVDGTRLRVLGEKSAYSPALRAKLLALKPEIVAHLRGEAEDSATKYERDVRAWEVEYVAHLARARGYSAEAAKLAAEIVSKRPKGMSFSVGAELIVVSMGAGCEVRVRRLRQAWANLVSDSP